MNSNFGYSVSNTYELFVIKYLHKLFNVLLATLVT